MRSRPLLLVAAMSGALLVTGCVNLDALTSGGGGDPRVQHANDMLAHPPGSGVQPTGRVVDVDLYLFNMTHELFPGAKMGMWGMSLSPDPSTARFPGPTLRVTEGDTLDVHFHSQVAGFNHTLHWHGQNVPNDQDGVPYVTQKPAEAGTETEYRFMATPAGTYWYHCHVDAQHHIDMGMYGVLIVDPQDEAADPHYDQEFVMALDDMDRYHLEGGQPATGNLPQGGDLYSWQQYLERQTNDVATRNTALDPLWKANTTLRPVRDWYPVTYAPYTADYNTYLINGVAFPYTSPLVVKENTVIRIRMANVGNTMMSMHLHGHHMLVTHKDGILLDSPYWVDTVVLGPGERYDVYVKMDNPGMWDLHDHFGGHTQNDNIFPGGAMTMLCYEGIEGCSASAGHSHGGRVDSGDVVLSRWNALWEALP